MDLELLKTQNNGLIQVVQIGAFDGLACAPLADLLLDENVTAVLVEPQAEAYEKWWTGLGG